MDELLLLVCSLVFSQLDYCNALYYLLKNDTLQLMQMVQNSAARLVAKVNKYERISVNALMHSYHWLKVKERIEFKILTLVYKCLNGLAPTDLSSSLVLLRSERSKQLVIPKYKGRYGERSFSVSGPKLWNSLPHRIRTTSNFKEFKKELKTHLFKKSYNL